MEKPNDPTRDFVIGRAEGRGVNLDSDLALLWLGGSAGL